MHHEDLFFFLTIVKPIYSDNNHDDESRNWLYSEQEQPDLKSSIEFQEGVECGHVEIVDMLPITWDSCLFNIFSGFKQINTVKCSFSL